MPPLANLLRTLEELSITGQYTGAEEAHTPFVVELIAEMRERLVQTYEGRYAAIAEDQKANVFVKETPDELKSEKELAAHRRKRGTHAPLPYVSQNL